MKRAPKDAAPRSAKVLNSTTITSDICGDVWVRLPVELPSLSRAASQVLLAILIELTEVPVLDGPAERGTE
jgi:hypothetical protein